MLRVLVVDDEIIVRKGLRNTIDWNKYGFDLVGEADDGTTALELTEQLKPDIIIIDICMPMMDGIKCLKNLKECDNHARVIILSGHDDFDFAKDAIRYGVFSYILKPVDNNELICQLLALKAEIDNERNNELEFDKLRTLVQENHLMIRERFLYNLVNGAFTDLDEVYKRLAFLKVKGLRDFLVVMVADIDNYPFPFEGLDEEEIRIRKFAMVDLAEQKVISLGEGCAFCGNDRQIIILFGLGNEKSESARYRHVFKLGEDIKESVNKALGLTITIGVSRTVRGIQTIKSAYIDALEAVNQKHWIGKDSIIFIQDIRVEKTVPGSYPIESEKEIIAAIREGDIEKATRGVDDFFKNILETKGLDIHQIREMILRLVFQVDRIFIEAGITQERINDQIQVQSVFHLQTIDDLKLYVCDLLKRTKVFLDNDIKATLRHEIYKAIRYINEHYNEPIDLSMVAEHIHLSMYYVSRLFKKETGKSFIDCLNEIRVEKAKILLRETDLKLYEIAEKVGYHNNVYFGQIFKKHANISPVDYKRKR